MEIMENNGPNRFHSKYVSFIYKLPPLGHCHHCSLGMESSRFCIACWSHFYAAIFFMGNKYGKWFIAFNMKYECTNQCTILCIFIESKLWSPRFKRFFCDNYNYAAIKMSVIEKLFNFYLILQKKLFFNDKCMLKTVIMHKKPFEKYRVQTSN